MRHDFGTLKRSKSEVSLTRPVGENCCHEPLVSMTEPWALACSTCHILERSKSCGMADCGRGLDEHSVQEWHKKLKAMRSFPETKTNDVGRERKTEQLPISVDPFRDQGSVELETAIVEELKWGRSPEVDDAEGDFEELCSSGGLDGDTDLKEQEKCSEPQKRLRINIITKHSRQSQSSAVARPLGVDFGTVPRSDEFLVGRAAVAGSGGGWFRRRPSRPDFGRGVLRVGVDTTELNRRFHGIHHSMDIEGLQQNRHDEEYSSGQQLSGDDNDAIQIDCLDSISDVQSFLFSTHSAEMSLKRYERTLQRMTSCISIRPAPDPLAGERTRDTHQAEDLLEAACGGILDYPEEQHMNRQIREVRSENVPLAGPDMTCRSCGERVGVTVLQHLPSRFRLCSPRCVPDEPATQDKFYINVSGMRRNRA